MMDYKVGDRFANRAENEKKRVIRVVGSTVKVYISEIDRVVELDHEYVQDSIKCGRWIKN